MGTVHDDGERIPVETTAEWGTWLEQHHGRHQGVWLVSWKKHTGRAAIGYDDAVTEALRFGWVDSLARRLDDDRSMLWFAPRRKGSAWSRSNKQRIARLETERRMEPAGRAAVDAAKADGTWSLLDEVEDLVVPDDLAAAFDTQPGSRAEWDAFPPSVRRGILEWIVLAKRPDTRSRRIEETARLARKGERANQRPPR